jgi:hypothetical protein
VARVRQHAEAAARRSERELAGLARIMRHGVRLHLDGADRQIPMRAQVLHAHDGRQRARGARRHPHGRVVTLGECRNALRMIRMLMRDENGGDVAWTAVDGLEPFLDDLARESAVDHEQRGAELHE